MLLDGLHPEFGELPVSGKLLLRCGATVQPTLA